MKNFLTILFLLVLCNRVNSQTVYSGYQAPEKTISFLEMSFTIDGRNYKLTNEGKSIQYEAFVNEKISYDFNNKVNKIGTIVVEYDFSKRISKIGAIKIEYDFSGRISKIGNATFNYDYKGRFTGSSGNIE